MTCTNKVLKLATVVAQNPRSYSEQTVILANELLRIDGILIDPEHPEAFCQDCRRPNAVWFAPNEIWNSVNADGNGILCPVCFIRKAEAVGIKDAWIVQPEFYKAKQ